MATKPRKYTMTVPNDEVVKVLKELKDEGRYDVVSQKENKKKGTTTITVQRKANPG